MKFVMKQMTLRLAVAMALCSTSVWAEEPAVPLTDAANEPMLISAEPILISANPTPADTANYQECLEQVAILGAGKQQNDQCFLYFKDQGTFISVTNPVNSGATVYIDELHYNFHKKDYRYQPFAVLLGKDGYTVESMSPAAGAESGLFAGGTTGNLPKGENDILLIANPLNKSDYPEANWVAPIESAYTEAEIDALVQWVADGGSLMLIADHFPFPGSVDQLAKRFGFYMDNGYHFDPNYNNVFLFDMLRSDLAQRIMRQEVTTKDPVPGTNDKGEPRTVKDDLVDAVRLIMVDLGAQVNALNFWASPKAEEAPPTIAYAKSDTIKKAKEAEELAQMLTRGMAEGDGWLNPNHPIAKGRNGMNEAIPYATSFTGQSFTYQKPEGAEGALHGEFDWLMRVGRGTYSLLTINQDAYFGVDQDASENNLVTYALASHTAPPVTVPKKDTSPVVLKNDNGKAIDASGNPITSSDEYTIARDGQKQYTLQGATLEYGRGKVAVFGEAGMFTAQIAADGRSQMGFNRPMAQYNQQFVLNTLHWLDGSLTDANANATHPGNNGLLAAKDQPLFDEVQLVAKKVKAAQDDRDARKDSCTITERDENANILSSHRSYACEYKESYDGTEAWGGCTLSSANRSTDPTLWVLALFALGYVARQRRGQQG